MTNLGKESVTISSFLCFLTFWLKIQGLPYWGWHGEGSPPTRQRFVHPPPPSRLSRLPHHQIFIPSLPKANSPHSICFNFILFWHTGHANFDFNWCSVFTECCFLVLKKVRIAKITPPGHRHLGKKIPPSNIFNYLPCITYHHLENLEISSYYQIVFGV